MRHFSIILAALAVLAAAPAEAAEKKAETHRHPSLPVSFKTFEGWHRVPRPGDEGTFEMASPSGTVHVLVWYTSTEQDAAGYLVKMSGMMGLDIHDGTEPDTLETEYHQMVHYVFPGTTLAVIDNGRTEERPRENALYIVKVVYPAEGCDDCEGLARRILGTVRVYGEGGP